MWLPEHLVFTRAMSRSPHPGEDHPPVPPDAPIYDAFAYLAFLAAQTERVRLGTHVFNIGLRHPFTTARGVQTVDLFSGGRFEFGIGASWLEEEWDATELDFATRGRRVDEAVEICKRLWTEETITHHGEFFSFDEVVFEPKPRAEAVAADPRRRRVEGRAAPRGARSATAGSAWRTRFESAAAQIATLRALLAENGRDPTHRSRSCSAVRSTSRDDVRRWEDIGVTRMIVSPWRRSPEAIEALADFAARII